MMTRCPRCSGQMTLEQDMHGKFWDCFQCGKHLDTVVNSGNAPQMVSVTGRPENMFTIAFSSKMKYVDSFTMGGERLDKNKQ